LNNSFRRRKELRAEGVSERIASLQELDLSDAQFAQIAVVRKECRPELAKALEGLRGLLTPPALGPGITSLAADPATTPNTIHNRIPITVYKIQKFLVILLWSQSKFGQDSPQRGLAKWNISPIFRSRLHAV
jgi:hypothetical protein